MARLKTEFESALKIKQKQETVKPYRRKPSLTQFKTRRQDWKCKNTKSGYDELQVKGIKTMKQATSQKKRKIGKKGNAKNITSKNS